MLTTDDTKSRDQFIVGISVRNQKQDKWLRLRINVNDVLKIITHLKWDYAGHVARTTGSEWNSKIIDWSLWEIRRNRPYIPGRTGVQMEAYSYFWAHQGSYVCP